MQKRGQKNFSLPQEPRDDRPRPGKLVFDLNLYNIGEKSDERELLRNPFRISATIEER